LAPRIHQKVVVIDDSLAFAGGIDLTMRRWDTSEHVPLDPRDATRTASPTRPFTTFRWSSMAARRAPSAASSRALAPRNRTASEGPASRRRALAEGLRVDLRDAAVAIARTEPSHAGRRAVREVQFLWADVLSAARRTIYIENQYLTAKTITETLIARLAEPQDPRSSASCRAAHGFSRDRLAHAQARQLRGSVRPIATIVSACLSTLPGDAPTTSAGCASTPRCSSSTIAGARRIVEHEQRSMGVDTECDLAIEATTRSTPPRSAPSAIVSSPSISAARRGVAATMAAHDFSLLRTIDALSQGGRRFTSLLDELPPDPLALHADEAEEANPFDPEAPIRPERLLDDFLPEAPSRHHISRNLVASIAYLCLIAALLAGWTFTPLRHLITLDALLAQIDAIRGSVWTPLGVLVAFVGGGLLMVPVLLLIAVSAIAFGPLFGFAYAIVGVFASASCSFAIGRLVGRELVHRIAGPRLQRIGQRLARSSILTVAAVRMLPIAPFTVVNLVAGAMHVRYRDYMVGTALG